MKEAEYKLNITWSQFHFIKNYRNINRFIILKINEYIDKRMGGNTEKCVGIGIVITFFLNLFCVFPIFKNNIFYNQAKSY